MAVKKATTKKEKPAKKAAVKKAIKKPVVKKTEKVEKVIYENHAMGELACDKVVCAIGQEHDEDSLKAPLRTGKDGCIEVNEKYQTIIPNIFAAGDCVHGPKTVIHAIAAGREAAQSMLEYLKEKS